MALMMDDRPVSYAGEQVVYDCFEQKLNKNIICYYNREVNGHEFDFCLLVKNMGLLVVEVKGWNISHIDKITSPDEIWLKGNNYPEKSPKKQARGYQWALLNYFQKHYGINPLIISCVCYPFLTEVQFNTCGLNIVSELDNTILIEDLKTEKTLMSKLGKIFNQHIISNFDKCNGTVYDIIRNHFENSVSEEENYMNYSELRIYPNNISISQISNILENYMNGVKEIIFINDENAFDVFLKNLTDIFKKRKICNYKGNIILNYDGDPKINVVEGKLSLFNFECYYIPNLCNVISEDKCIINGDCNDCSEILEFIAKNSTFNYQQYLVEHAQCEKHIQVKAGAGTGKTYSMISRISYLCNESSKSGIINPAEEIAMLTFTDDAALNMRNRIKKQFRNYFALTLNKKYLDLISAVERMRISTIHSFAKDIIQRTSIPLGIGSEFSTVSGVFQRRQILRRKLSDYFEKKIAEDESFIFNLPVSIYELESYLLDFVDKCYSKGIDIKNINPDSFGIPILNIPYIKELITDVLTNTEKEYSNYLLDNNQIDLDEYMIYLNKCICHESFNPKLYGFKYIFIDEFQDVDDSQISTFIEMNKKINFKYFIVGDLKQSIYRFRGATMDAFTKMGCNSSKWLTYSLNTNYRSDKRLLIEYQSIFSRMGNNNLIPYSSDDSLIGIKQNKFISSNFIEKIEYNSEDEKNDNFYDYLFDCVSKRKSELESIPLDEKLSIAEKTIAILVRKNYEVSKIIKEGLKRNIIIESDKNTNLYKLQSTIDLCKLTSALCNPYNSLYLYDLIQSNNINVKFDMLNLVNKSNDEKLNILIKCLDAYYQSVLKMTWCELISYVQKNPTLQVLRSIYESSKPWKTYSIDLDKETYYRINYELIFEELSRANKKSYLTLESINESLILATTKEMTAKSRDLVESDDRIRIKCVTVHASKGLEYDTVILPLTKTELDSVKKDSVEIAVENGKIGYCFNFKDARYYNEYFDVENEKEEVVKEESRILYVALTRAINKFIWFGKDTNEKYNWNKILDGDDLCH